MKFIIDALQRLGVTSAIILSCLLTELRDIETFIDSVHKEKILKDLPLVKYEWEYWISVAVCT